MVHETDVHCLWDLRSGTVAQCYQVGGLTDVILSAALDVIKVHRVTQINTNKVLKKSFYPLVLLTKKFLIRDVEG